MPTIQLTFIDNGAVCDLHRFYIGLFGRYRLSLTAYAYAQSNSTHTVVELVSPQLTLGVQVKASTATTSFYGGSNFRFIATNNTSHLNQMGKEIELNTVILQGYIDAQFFQLVAGTSLADLTNFDNAVLYIHAEPLDTYTTQNLLN
jgi:hypothetical protein